MTKELEALESIKSILYWYYDCNSINKDCRKQKEFDTIKQALLKAQEQEKVLEVIRKRHIDILDVEIYKTYKHYCRAIEDSGLRKDWWLTQEEYELLKRWING